MSKMTLLSKFITIINITEKNIATPTLEQCTEKCYTLLGSVTMKVDDACACDLNITCYQIVINILITIYITGQVFNEQFKVSFLLQRFLHKYLSYQNVIYVVRQSCRYNVWWKRCAVHVHTFHDPIVLHTYKVFPLATRTLGNLLTRNFGE